MGYDTNFKGELKFTNELTAKQIARLQTFLGEDCREHPEWNRNDITWIDLEFTKDFSGIRWNGSEKTYDLAEKINLIINEMQKEFPDFGLKGELLAQGEDINDRYYIIMQNNKAIISEIVDLQTYINNNLDFEALNKMWISEIYNSDEIDPNYENDWSSLCYGWALGKGLCFVTAQEFVNQAKL